MFLLSELSSQCILNLPFVMSGFLLSVLTVLLPIAEEREELHLSLLVYLL